MPIQFACACGEPLSFADDQSGARAACPRCGAALTVPLVGLFVAAGDRRRSAAEKAVPVAAPYAPPPAPAVKPPPIPIAAPFAPPPPAPTPPRRRRYRAWLAAAAVLLLAGGSLPWLLPTAARPPEGLAEPAPAPAEEETALASIAEAGRVREGQSPEKEEALSPIAPPRPAPEKEEEPAADPIQLQRLRAAKDVTQPLARDLRNELRLLRAEQAERRAEAQQVRRQLDKLRAEMSADAVHSVKEAVEGEPGEALERRLAARGRDALAERDYDVAVRELTRAAALDPDDPDVRALLEAARAAQEKVNKDVPEALEKAKEALFKDDVEEARNIYDVLLLVAPKDKRVRDAVGRLQARMAKGEVNTGGSRWLTVEEIAGRTDLPSRRPHDWWTLGGVNPEVTARAIAYGRIYRSNVEEQTARGRAAGRERDDALVGETDRAWAAGRERDAGSDEQGRRMRTALGEGLEEGTARSDRAGREARVAWEAQGARMAQVGREMEGVWRQQGERSRDGAAGQMLGLLNQHGRIAEAIRGHGALLWEQGGRMGGGGGVGWAEQGDRARGAGRDLDAGLRVLIGRAEAAGRRFDDGLRAENDRGRGARNEPGGGEVDDRFRVGARTGRDNLAGQGVRFSGGRLDREEDERSRDALGRLTGQELEDRIRWGAREQRIALENRNNADVQPRPEPDAPPPPPRVEDPAAKEKERDDAERALEERNRKAHEVAELKRLLAERERQQRDLDELKKLVAEREAQQREADELKLLLAEQERMRRLRDGFKGIAQEPKKE